jgi:hypothetical protein
MEFAGRSSLVVSTHVNEGTEILRRIIQQRHDVEFASAVMNMRVAYDRITTTIEREWLAQIIGGTKKIEYRRIKPYWTKRFSRVSVPFELRLLNGMNRPVPEVTVLIHKITKDSRAGEYRLHIKKILGFKHWDK